MATRAAGASAHRIGGSRLRGDEAGHSAPRARVQSDRERGTAMIELAISLVFLGVVVFGTVDIGRAFMTWNQVKNAAREGAAYAERDPFAQAPSGSSCANPDNITYRARTENGTARPELVVTTRLNGTAYTGCKDSGTFPVSSGDKVEVRVATPFNPISPLGKLLVGTPSISADVEVVVQ
jgi:Flp pilus assembly protein TadG